MKKLIVVGALVVSGLLAPSKGVANPYLRPGFNQINAGAFFPLAGADGDLQAGFIVPAIEHDSRDGYLFLPGVSWNPLNIGYVGSVQADIKKFLRGKLALGPSIQTGELVKKGLRWACGALPVWHESGRYEVLKGILAPGAEGVYADVGVYGALPLNAIFPVNKAQPELLLGATLNKRWGGAVQAPLP